MVGTAFAALVAPSGLEVAVIDAGKQTTWSADSYASRVSALNIATERMLGACGAWDPIASRRASPFRSIYVWDPDSRGRIAFDSASVGLNHLGHIVENDLVVAMLNLALDELSAVTVLSETEITDVNTSPGGVTINTQTGREIRARLLVGADGATSRVREALDIPIAERPYGHQAIVARVATEKDHQHTAWQRFMASGPLAFLPLADGTCSIVWSCDDALADELNALDDGLFATRLEAAFESRLGAITRVEGRRCFPLHRRHAHTYLAESAVLIGDAAHTVHPLAGIGANLGIADAGALAEIITDCAGVKADFGKHAMLRRYERWRKSENERALAVMDGFHGLFGTRNPAVTALRGFGLNATDRLDPLKQLFIRTATGLSGDLPRSAQHQRDQ